MAVASAGPYASLHLAPIVSKSTGPIFVQFSGLVDGDDQSENAVQCCPLEPDRLSKEDVALAANL